MIANAFHHGGRIRPLSALYESRSPRVRNCWNGEKTQSTWFGYTERTVRTMSAAIVRTRKAVGSKIRMTRIRTHGDNVGPNLGSGISNRLWGDITTALTRRESQIIFSRRRSNCNVCSSTDVYKRAHSGDIPATGRSSMSSRYNARMSLYLSLGCWCIRKCCQRSLIPVWHRVNIVDASRAGRAGAT